MGTPGRNRLHIRAVCPDWVMEMIARRRQVIGGGAGGVGDGGGDIVRGVVLMIEALPVVDGLLVRRAMVAIVRTASTGYLPAALSPESMMALVPS